MVTAEAQRIARINGRRNKIRLPEGATSLIDQVRLGMSMGHINAMHAAKAVGLHRETYSLARKLLLLKSRQVLTMEDEKRVNHALSILNDDLLISPAKKIADPVLRKYWIGNTHHGEYRERGLSVPYKKKRTRFDNTIFAIREACTNNDELEIPLGITRTEKEEVGHILNESIAALTVLKQKLMGDDK